MGLCYKDRSIDSHIQGAEHLSRWIQASSHNHYCRMVIFSIIIVRVQTLLETQGKVSDRMGR